ncbi:MAG: glycosyltransferase family 2 protein [Candidatus Sumerlaeia bacterium]|nr:glycosyltransferase family 2 protein [Candidatus Sumerlaeia bacterium]
MSPAPPPDLSFVIPVFDERDSIAEVYARCAAVAARLNLSYEILVVDDGSTDGTDAVLRDLAAKDEHLTVILFRRNFGKSAALDAGIQNARGAIIVTLDGDLQDAPEDLPALLEALRAGYDVAVGRKTPRRDSFGRVLSSRLFNLLVSLLAGRRFHDCNSGFKAFRRDVAGHLELYGERHRFVPVLAHWKGFRVTEVPVHHEPRRFGRSKYGAGRFLAGFFDLWSIGVLTRFRHKPLHFFGQLGAASFAVGFVILLVLTILRLTVAGFWFGRHLPWAFFGILLVLVGVQVFTTGLICELVVNLRPDRRADFVIKEIIRKSNES